MCYVTDVSYNGTRHQVNMTSGPEALIALGLAVNTNILYYFPWINNKAELICFQQRLSKKYLRFSLKLTENKITFQRKQPSFCKGRKSKVWFEFLFMFFSLGHLFSLPWKGFPEKKKKKYVQFSGFKAWQHFVISFSSRRQMKLRRVCQASGALLHDSLSRLSVFFDTWKMFVLFSGFPWWCSVSVSKRSEQKCIFL